ncbi:MAG TPA: hypothetical protein VGM86_28070 [Thermoanaerobaculia bacterium]|jgi:hypothetical protein
MSRAFILATLALTLTGGAASRAAEKPQASAPAVLEHAPRGTVVFDDDGGRAQIVPRRAVPSQEAKYHGGPVVSQPTVQAVFLGSGWRKQENRQKEAAVMSALRSQGGPAAKSLSPYGVKPWELSGQPLEDLTGDPLRGTSISDLEIQTRLDGLLGGADPLDANTVYVVFLAPGLGSTLGPRATEKDYLAYHNHVHAAAGVIHYAVVPYDGDPARWAAAARQSLRLTLINPEGNGWY